MAGIFLFNDLRPNQLCHAAEPANGPTGPTGAASPFDKDDPELAELRKLNWKSIDFDNSTTVPAARLTTR
jgi:hypothetical protein